MHVLARAIAIASIAVQRNRNEIVVLVVTNEIDDGNAGLVRELAQSSSQLLREHDAGLGVAQHHDLIDGRDIDTFIEFINGKDVIKITGFKPINGSFHISPCGFAADGDSSVIAFRLLVGLLIEQFRESFCLLHPGAEHQSRHRLVVRAVLFEFTNDVLHA